MGSDVEEDSGGAVYAAGRSAEAGLRVPAEWRGADVSCGVADGRCGSGEGAGVQRSGAAGGTRARGEGGAGADGDCGAAAGRRGRGRRGRGGRSVSVRCGDDGGAADSGADGGGSGARGGEGEDGAEGLADSG